MEQDSINRPAIYKSDSGNIGNAIFIPVKQFVQPERYQEKCFKPSDITLYITAGAYDPARDKNKNPEVFPFTFICQTREFRDKQFSALKESLKEGIIKENPQLKADWMMPVLMISAMIYIILSKIPGSLFSSLLNFITFKGLRDKYQADAERIFRVQSTMMNLASFINISLFLFVVIIEKDIAVPLHGTILLWFACFALIASAVTARHLITVLTGILSEERDLFASYLSAVYSFYRLTGILSFFLVILVIYSNFLPAGFLMTLGFIIVILLIIFRIITLVLLFVNRRASVLYLILYLCALEILPVAVLIKYVTGLISGL